MSTNPVIIKCGDSTRTFTFDQNCTNYRELRYTTKSAIILFNIANNNTIELDNEADFNKIVAFFNDLSQCDGKDGISYEDVDVLKGRLTEDPNAMPGGYMSVKPGNLYMSMPPELQEGAVHVQKEHDDKSHIDLCF